MIVSESDILTAALDRRLQVDALKAVEPLKPVTGRADAGASPNAGVAVGASMPGPSGRDTLLSRLPLGSIVSARVVEVPQPDQVIAEVAEVRIAMSWPVRGGVTPLPGQAIALRVLAHRPMLLLQSVVDDAGTTAPPDETTRWSGDALRLQAAAGRSTSSESGVTRFDVPILEIEIEAVASDDQDRAQASAISSPMRSTRRPSFPAGALADGPASIAIDDVIVAHGTALVDGVPTPLVPRTLDDEAMPNARFMPLVLQGPAWPGQAIELVIRREREDEQFDNPVLDHWCGEVVIDLPSMGRVAGHLSFSMQGLRIRLEGDEAASVATMNAAAGDLATAFAETDLRVIGLTIGQQVADATQYRTAGSHPSSRTFGVDRG